MRSIIPSTSDTVKDDDLYVPTEEEWRQLSNSEQNAVEERIMFALDNDVSFMGETTLHFQARASASEVLRRYYDNRGKAVFIASDLYTLYPGEQAFYPDLLVVFDVENHHRRTWNVMAEGKGLDFVLEILSRGTRRVDQVQKLNLFARLGIPEYFIFDPDKYALSGYSLENQAYHPITAKDNRSIFSETLGLYLIVDNYKLRFIIDGIDIPFGDELIKTLNQKLDGKNQLIANNQLLLEQERKQRKKEKKKKNKEIKKVKARSNALEKKLAEALKQLEQRNNDKDD